MNPIRRRLLGACVLALGTTLGACQVPGSGEPPQLYTLSPKNSFAPDLPKVEWQLIVETPVAAAGLNTSRIALQRHPLRIDYYGRAAWIDPAPLLVQTLLIESFENTQRIVGVARESAQLRADYVLQTELREFQAEHESGGALAVRVRLISRLVRMPDRAIIANLSAERVERAERGDLDGVARAFDEALGKVLRRTVEWALVAPGTTRRPAGGRTSVPGG